MQDQWNHKMFNLASQNFEALAMEAFHLQYEANSIYRSFVDALGVDPAGINHLHDIPFLPISFFKSHTVKTGSFETETIFESSGTTQNVPSRHFVKDISLYSESFLRAFQLFYGSPKDWCIIGFLPSYLERAHSSLVFMVHELIRQSGHPGSGFYLHDFDKMDATLGELEHKGQKTLLIGVTFALLDFASRFPRSLQHTLIMETGGMKGRRKEMIRAEVHDILKKAFSLSTIHSEYGMTELLSQAYSRQDGIFYCPPWMRITLRDEEDPLTIRRSNGGRLPVNGAINIIDLANIHSCCFIATDDAGRLHTDGGFEVLGRMDNSDLRGCSLMAV
jgi:hypothetical protein